jgi:hypothetical protein
VKVEPTAYHLSNIVDTVNFGVVGFEDTNDVARLQRGQRGLELQTGSLIFPHTHVVMVAIDIRMMIPGIIPRVSNTNGIDRTPRPIWVFIMRIAAPNQLACIHP